MIVGCTCPDSVPRYRVSIFLLYYNVVVVPEPPPLATPSVHSMYFLCRCSWQVGSAARIGADDVEDAKDDAERGSSRAETAVAALLVVS